MSLDDIVNLVLSIHYRYNQPTFSVPLLTPNLLQNPARLNKTRKM